MEEEEAAAQLAADRNAADKGAAAGSHVDLDDMEDSDIAEEVEQQPLDMFVGLMDSTKMPIDCV
jgi:hypothetical protein